MSTVHSGVNFFAGDIQHERGKVGFHGSTPVAQAAAPTAAVALTDDRIIAGNPVLAIGTTANTAIKITNAVHLVIGGALVTVPAQEVAFTATTHDIADPDTDPREAIYLLSADADGAVTITKGDDAAADAAVAPSVPAGEVELGQVLIQHNGSAIFNATTDALNAAHLTVTYTNNDTDGTSTAIEALITRVGELVTAVRNLGLMA